MTLTPLIEALESAEAGSRELDAQVFRAIGAPVPFQFANKLAALTYDERDRCYYAPVDNMRVRYEPPAYTASLDAATSLFPTGTMYRSGHDGAGPDPSLFYCEAITDAPACHRVRAVASTESLARSSAALKARAHSQGGGR